MERPMELSLRKFRNADGCPGFGTLPMTARTGTVIRLVVLVALNISTRYSKLRVSPSLNALAIERSRLLKPGANMVFLPTVRALGNPIPSIQCTVFGSTHNTPPWSGLEKPLGHVGVMVVRTARVFKGAEGLLI